MAPLTTEPLLDSTNAGTSVPAYLNRPKSASENQFDEARVIFNKTIEGQYRHGKTGYRRVGALFLTWADDDMKCETTEVASLRNLLKTDFHFKTEHFEIPSQRWETALHKRLADFCHEYDSAEDLAIIYYGGHGYEGKETKEFKLAAKFANDGNGDPTAFFNDIRTCLRLPSCDQLMILDCCYAARAFAREHVGKRKFELLASAAHDVLSPAPHLPHSFTRNLHDTMKRLLKENPNGFSTPHLYREVYHTIPTTQSYHYKPLLFNQARNNFGNIWLRPQVQTDRPPKSIEEGRYLKLTFRLNESPDLAVMNELALQLQFLPHVDQIRFEDMYAPKEQITDFMRWIVLASKLRPLVRRLQARRQRRKLISELGANKDEKAPSSLIELHLAQNQHELYDWSNASRDHGHTPNDTQNSQHRKKKCETWPTAQKAFSCSGPHSKGTISTHHQSEIFGPCSCIPKSAPGHVSTTDHASNGRATGLTDLVEVQPVSVNGCRKRQRSASFQQDTPPKKTQIIRL